MTKLAELVVLFMALVFAASVTQLYGWAGGLVGLFVLFVVGVFILVEGTE